ncbi:MAG: hypothetical protein LAQ30_14995 [Acidobacteriia bacterium]|nr:hypothetical protein [Terriglobia bacterium]
MKFIVVGGAAATAHGSARLTLDLDIVYERTPENLARMIAAFAPHKPYLRGAPAGLPFQWEERTLSMGLNFTLTTAIGDIDLLGEITGGGGYDALLPSTIVLRPYGIECLCLTLESLIRVKRATGRPKDMEALAELEAIWDEGRERG